VFCGETSRLKLTPAGDHFKQFLVSTSDDLTNPLYRLDLNPMPPQGVRASHQDFLTQDGTRSRVLPGFNAVGDNLGTADCNGHGTHCAGIAAGRVSGVAKNAYIHSGERTRNLGRARVGQNGIKIPSLSVEMGFRVLGPRILILNGDEERGDKRGNFDC
jgi:subtilisin family serine protease